MLSAHARTQPLSRPRARTLRKLADIHNLFRSIQTSVHPRGTGRVEGIEASSPLVPERRPRASVNVVVVFVVVRADGATATRPTAVCTWRQPAPPFPCKARESAIRMQNQQIRHPKQCYSVSPQYVVREPTTRRTRRPNAPIGEPRHWCCPRDRDGRRHALPELYVACDAHAHARRSGCFPRATRLLGASVSRPQWTQWTSTRTTWTLASLLD